MSKQLKFSQILAIGFMLLAMFLGAGNIIFAPKLGQEAGTNTWLAMGGFLITGVGLVLLAIIALAIGGGKVEVLAGLVSSKFSKIFSILLFLTLGPIYVIPRTTSVVYEISINPLLSESLQQNKWILFFFSLFFIALTIWLSMNPGKFVDRLGKMITPVFGILLAVLIIKSFITPMGTIGAPTAGYLENVFLQGFVKGYYTMDVLAAFVFGGIFIKAIANEGITKQKDISSTFIKSGIITVVGLTIIQLSMAWIGATSVDAIGSLDNGGAILAQSANVLFGNIGFLMIGVVIFLTGITTNIACLSSVAEYFEREFPTFSYVRWMFVLSFFSLIFTNFGLTKVLEMASPILLLLYPISIALIILIFLHRAFNGYQAVYVGTIIGVGIVAVLDAIKEAGFLVAEIDSTFQFIPLFSNGAGWLVTGLIGGIIGYIVAKSKQAPARPRPALES